MKKLLCVLFVGILFSAFAQSSKESDKGIYWTRGLSWQQVKEKAKKENKYIFLDCFATWCGPCKLMDQQVYPNETVGNFFNKNFICVKVQMDRTKTDNEEVKSWYSDANVISRDYHVEGFPTFIFLTPQGTLVNKDLGFKNINAFMDVANTALIPGRRFEDPYASYDDLISEYKNGKRDYDSYPFMITMSGKKRQLDLQKQLLKELTDYLITVEKEKRYTKERIEMWDQFTFGSNSQTFQWIFKDAKQIDALVSYECKQGNLKRLKFNKKGWAETMVDRTIQLEIVGPFFAEQNKNSKISMSGMYLRGKGLQFDSSEADWTELKKRIEKKYSSDDYAKRNIRIAKVEWYTRHRNYAASAKWALIHLNKDFLLEHDNPYIINNFAWDAFDYSNDKKVIKGYIKWMNRIVTTRVKDNASVLDTYANLLYKIGQKTQAIAFEEKAMNLSGGTQSKFAKRVEMMKREEPTWTTSAQ
jgi:thioredoxin-related protein